MSDAVERMKKIPLGLCGCGCGRKTWVPKYDRPAKGYVAGEPRRFAQGHSRRVFPLRGEDHGSWKGGRRVHDEGYIMLHDPDHERAGPQGYVLEHVKVVSDALGKSLPATARVHHVNGVRDDNRPSNLVACENDAYHALLHYRQRALEECGNANWLRCQICGEWDEPSELYTSKTNTYHSDCHAARMRAYKAKQRDEERKSA